MMTYKEQSYRQILQNEIKAQPRKGWGYLGRLAQIVGVSATQMSQVLSGKKNLSLEQAHRLTQELQWSEPETEFFLALLQMERAGSRELRRFFEQKLQTLREAALDLKTLIPPTHELNSEDKEIFYSDWRFSAVRLFCSIGKGATAAEISAEFHLSPARTQAVLKFLSRTALCRLDQGRYVMGPQRTFISTGTAAFFQHQTNWRLLALERSKQASPDSIFFTSPVSLSENDFAEFSQTLRELIQSFSEKVRPSKAETVACLNIDYFKMT